LYYYSRNVELSLFLEHLGRSLTIVEEGVDFIDLVLTDL